jgi:selenocysteine-specific elongation factor
MIVAMAGHVDHGKTSLIRALTGIDPDTAPDEKRRGMTIDLGFAHADFPGAGTIGFVDVPGHERFLTNMLAGVLSVDSVLLVVAADDGPMPQTAEHLAILRLTSLRDLTVALTKIDRVDPARRAAAEGEIHAALSRAGYLGAPLLRVSAHTGEGIDALRDALRAKAAAWTPRAAEGGFRMAIDRVFTVQGAGLVVAGTVAAGAVALGDKLVLTTSHLSARVRAIQRHHADAEAARAGDRCALAIAGPRLERARMRRGEWLVAPHLDAPTRRLDLLVRAAPDRGLKHGSRTHLHIGAAALPARALVRGGADLPPGDEAFVSLALDREIAALWGDRAVLRDDSTGRVAAGGTVVDPFPPERRQKPELRALALVSAARVEPREALAGALDAEGWVDLARMAVARNRPVPVLLAAAEGLGADRLGSDARPVLLSAARAIRRPRGCWSGCGNGTRATPSSPARANPRCWAGRARRRSTCRKACWRCWWRAATWSGAAQRFPCPGTRRVWRRWTRRIGRASARC